MNKAQEPETLRIWIQPGKLGHHAGAYHSRRVWAAHPKDIATAAWRCAVKFWFGKGHNSAWLYSNVLRVTVAPDSDHTWIATLAPATAPDQCPLCKRSGFTKAGLLRHKCKPDKKAVKS